MKAKQVIALVDVPGWTARVFDDGSVERSGAPDAQVTESDQLDILRRVVVETARIFNHERPVLVWGGGENGVLVRIAKDFDPLLRREQLALIGLPPHAHRDEDGSGR